MQGSPFLGQQVLHEVVLNRYEHPGNEQKKAQPEIQAGISLGPDSEGS